MAKVNFEEFYLECIKQGLNDYEVDIAISRILFYRVLDESPSGYEAYSTHAQMFESSLEAGAYDEDIAEMEEETEIAKKTNPSSTVSKNESNNQLPSYQQMAQDIKELKDNMNDLLIDKHLWNVVVSNNIKNSETSDDTETDDIETKEKPRNPKKRAPNKKSNNATKDNNNKEKGE